MGPMKKIPGQRSPVECARALDQALEAQRARTALVRAIKNGEVDCVQALERAARDALAGDMLAKDFLLALPGVGPAQTAKLMARLGLSDSRRLRSLAPGQRELIGAAVRS